MNNRYSPFGALALILLVLFASTLSAQEFTIYPNGLIYHDSTIARLRTIVDSLNVRFRACDPAGPYISYAQGHGHFVRFVGRVETINGIRAMMDNGAPYQTVVQEKKQFIESSSTNILIVKLPAGDNGDSESPSFVGLNGLDSYQYVAPYGALKYQEDIPAGSWVYRINTRKHDEATLSAFFFTSDLRAGVIPERYARLIQYADCMVDTTTGVYTSAPGANGYSYDEGTYDSLIALPILQHMLEYPGMPEFGNDVRAENFDAEYKRYLEIYRDWQRQRDRFITDTLARHERFRDILAAAVEELLHSGRSADGEIEALAERYLSKHVALRLKRNRNPMGTCSQDMTPRIHALQISLLAAETASWDVFLRAHLNIMNDNFARVTDGSYAWGSRGTYIRELEALDINVLDLLLGISLQYTNRSRNHYNGSISRIGRALAELEDREEFESRISAMMRDTTLDDYNRTCLYNLYLNYLYSLEDGKERAARLTELQENVAHLPGHLHAATLELKAEEE